MPGGGWRCHFPYRPSVAGPVDWRPHCLDCMIHGQCVECERSTVLHSAALTPPPCALTPSPRFRWLRVSPAPHQHPHQHQHQPQHHAGTARHHACTARHQTVDPHVLTPRLRPAPPQAAVGAGGDHAPGLRRPTGDPLHPSAPSPGRQLGVDATDRLNRGHCMYPALPCPVPSVESTGLRYSRPLQLHVSTCLSAIMPGPLTNAQFLSSSAASRLAAPPASFCVTVVRNVIKRDISATKRTE